MNYPLNGTGFTLEDVLLHESKEAWLEWAAPRHFDGFSDVQKARYLTEVWEAAQKFKKQQETEQIAATQTAPAPVPNTRKRTVPGLSGDKAPPGTPKNVTLTDDKKKTNNPAK